MVFVFILWWVYFLLTAVRNIIKFCLLRNITVFVDSDKNNRVRAYNVYIVLDTGVNKFVLFVWKQITVKRNHWNACEHQSYLKQQCAKWTAPKELLRDFSRCWVSCGYHDFEYQSANNFLAAFLMISFVYFTMCDHLPLSFCLVIFFRSLKWVMPPQHQNWVITPAMTSFPVWYHQTPTRHRPW